jgi:hypothetical protein
VQRVIAGVGLSVVIARIVRVSPIVADRGTP